MSVECQVFWHHEDAGGNHHVVLTHDRDMTGCCTTLFSLLSLIQCTDWYMQTQYQTQYVFTQCARGNEQVTTVRPSLSTTADWRTGARIMVTPGTQLYLPTRASRSPSRR